MTEVVKQSATYFTLRPAAASSWRGHPVLEEPIAGQARLLHRTITEADIAVGQLWWRYFSLGAHAGQLEVDAYLHQALHLPRLQRQLLDQTARELSPD